MATTPVQFKAPSGLALTLELYPYGSDTLANTGGDAGTEKTNNKGVYSADVTEALTGWHDALILDGSSNVIANYAVYLEDDTAIKRCHDPADRIWPAEDGAIPTAAANAADGLYTLGGTGVDVAKISGDSAAADNLEAMLDGTGGVTLTTSIAGDILGNVLGNVGGDVLGSVQGNVQGNLVGQLLGDVEGKVLGGGSGTITGIAIWANGTSGQTIATFDDVAAVKAKTDELPSPARTGTAQAGAAGTITLDASASAVTDFYVGAIVHLTGGTGSGQARVITAYNGTSKVAMISPNWATNPDNTSTFSVHPVPNLALLPLIKLKTDTISGTVTVTGPFDPNNDNLLTLVAGDGYESTERKLVFTFTNYAGPSLAGATGKIRFTKAATYQLAGTVPADLEASATIGVAGSTVTVTVILSEANTTLLQPAPTVARFTHVYQLIATTAANEDTTLLIGNAKVTRRIDPVP